MCVCVRACVRACVLLLSFFLALPLLIFLPPPLSAGSFINIPENDQNKDGLIDIADIVLLVGVISNGLEPTCL